MIETLAAMSLWSVFLISLKLALVVLGLAAPMLGALWAISWIVTTVSNKM